jgi:hypothetical protein
VETFAAVEVVAAEVLAERRFAAECQVVVNLRLGLETGILFGTL